MSFDVTQHQAILYVLRRQRKADRAAGLPYYAHTRLTSDQIAGRCEIPELKTSVFISSEARSRLSEIWEKNPGLLDREWVPTKDGGKQYGWRLSANVSPELIKDASLKEFYAELTKPRQTNVIIENDRAVEVIG